MEVDSTHFETMEEERVENKRKLNEVLGLNEGNNYRAILNESLSETQFRIFFPETTKFIKYSTGENKFSIINNKIYTGKNIFLKLSKVLSKKLENCLPDDEYQVYRASQIELGINSSYSNNYVSCLIDATKPKNLCISTNIYDMLTSSTDASYTSCYNMDGGEYFNGNLSYIRDSFTAITFVYTEDIHRKVGRAWAYIFPDNFKFAMPDKKYGSIYNQQRKVIRKYIERQISNYKGVKPYWKFIGKINYHSNEQYNGCDWAGYLDADKIGIAYHKRKTDAEAPYLDFVPARCLVCGDLTSDHESGSCDECNGRNWCECCEENFRGETYSHPDGGVMCESCYERYFFSCARCGETHSDNDSFYAQNYGDVCQSCYENYFSLCDECGEIHHNDRMTNINSEGITVCPQCLGDYSICEGCYEYFSNGMNEINGKHLCEDCMKYEEETVEITIRRNK